MDGSAINEIERLALEARGSNVVEVGGKDYSNVVLYDPRKADPEPKPLEVTTLASLADYVAANRDRLELADCAIHIASPHFVVLLDRLQGEFQQRFSYVHAKARRAHFEQGKFYTAEEINILLQTLFLATEGRAYALRLLGAIRHEAAVVLRDDGSTQRVETKAGVTLSEFSDVRNPILLAPYRTFLEVTQPESPFTLRVRTGPQGVTAALFEADGGFWQAEAIAGIKAYLLGRDETIGLPIFG